MSTENPVTVPIMVARRPITSAIGPTASAPTMTPSRPTVTTTEAPAGSRSQVGSRSSTGMTTPSTTRSKPSRATAVQQSGRTHPVAASRAVEPLVAARGSVVITHVLVGWSVADSM